LEKINFHRSLTKFPSKNFVNKICLEPFRTIEISLQGEVGLCGCAGWMPVRVGNIFRQPIGEILGSPLAQDIRASIGRGSYEYCNAIKCGVISTNGLIGIESVREEKKYAIDHPETWTMPNDIYLGGDMTCNLTCPSCRKTVFKVNSSQIQQQLKLGQILKNNLFSNSNNQTIFLHVSTSGEVFASPLLLEFISSIEPEKFPNLKLWIQSNGLLAPKFWHKLGAMADRVDNITVTVDAAQKNTYEKLRRGGKWKDLLDSLEWLRNKKNENGMSLNLRMIVQRDNIDQMMEFYELGQKYSAKQIDYAKIINWGTYSESEFKEIDVFDIDHPDRDAALKKLEQIKKLPNIQIAGGL
jgi:MoaA/NifB/PqqE/SkfB family radical SAM enzyme